MPSLIEKYYEVGRMILKAQDKRLKETGTIFGDHLSENIAEEQGVKAAEGFKARQVASCYTLDQLRQFEKAGLCKAHFLALVPISDEESRYTLTWKCADEKWSLKRPRFA
jgi:hypothetical protein